MNPKLLLFGMVAMFLLFCSTNKKHLRENEKTPPAQNPLQTSQLLTRPDTVIQMYSGGGATGFYSGCEISTRGEVRLFTRNPQGRILKEISGKIDPDSVRQMLRQLPETKIFQSPVNKTGNVTYYFIYQDPQRKFSVSWVSPEEVPEAFWKWYSTYRTRCQQWAVQDRK